MGSGNKGIAIVLRESKLGQRYLHWVGQVPVPLLHRLDFRPNQLTLLALLFSLLILPAYVHSLGLGGVSLLLAGALDTLDGSLARRTGRQSAAGAFLDSVFDRTSDFLMHLGIWVYFRVHLPTLLTPATLLLFFHLHGSFLVSYARARGEGLGLSTSAGLWGRGERILALGLGSLFFELPPRIWPGADWAQNQLGFLVLLGLLVVGVHCSAARRIQFLYRNLH